VHYLELDQFIAADFLITVHGPSAPRCRSRRPCARPAPSPLEWTAARLHAASPFGLSYAIVSSIARQEADMVAEIAREVGLHGAAGDG
jgi:hypothetical protein